MNILLSSVLAACLALPTFTLPAFTLPAQAIQLAEGETLADNQTYTFWLPDAIKTPDPQKNTDVAGADILRQLFEGLFTEDDTGALLPGVATHYDVSDDRLTYTFHLRDSAKWSNGDAVVAGDFVYAWRRLGNPATASEHAWFLELMNVANATDVIKGEKSSDQLGVAAPDDRTLVVTLTTPTPYFPKMLVHAATFPVNEKVVEVEGNGWTQPGKLVGNGAFILTGHDPGGRITMEKNPNYWDADNVVMTSLTGLTVTDSNIALTRYLAGELDRVQVPPGQFPRLQGEHPDQAVSLPHACTYGYLMNLGPKGPEALKDLRVRQALSYAMPRDVVVNQILQGGQQPAYSWTHSAIEGFRMPEIDYAHWTQGERLDRAEALLAEAGYGLDNPLKLTLQYNTDEAHKRIAVAAQQFYKTIGIELTPNNIEWKVHTDRMQSGDFELARYAWCADYNEASTFLDFFRTGGMNYGAFSDGEFDGLLAASKTSDDPNVQYTAAEQILARDMPLVPIYHYTKVDMINPAIRGLPQGNVMGHWYARNLYRIAK